MRLNGEKFLNLNKNKSTYHSTRWEKIRDG